MTNPNNAVGTNAAYSGRTSPNALNDILASFTKGIVSGWNCSPKAGMTVQLGGTANVRDVAFAEDNAGNKLTVNNRSGAPIEITLSGAPSTNNRIDAIIAYVDNPSTGDGNTTDNPTTCGIIAVSGSVAANPTVPSEATIRAAITTDGATGGSAYYVILATILVGTNVTTIGSGVITQGDASVTLGTASQALTKATQTAQALLDFESKFNMTQFVTVVKADMTKNYCAFAYGSVKIACNADGSIGKVYGFLGGVNSTSSSNEGYLEFDSPLRPTTDITINDAVLGIQFGYSGSSNSESSIRVPIKIKTNGKIQIEVSSYYYNRNYNYYLPPCLYFMKDFGD